jgi:hypothetical protein
MCVVAAQQASRVARRGLAVQYQLTLLHDTAPERDTLPRQAIAIARACGAHFTLRETAPTDLPGLFTLALLEGDDSLADAVVRRRLTSATDSAARQYVLVEAVRGYLAAEPARVIAASHVMALADSLATAEHANSLLAHQPFLGIARRAFDRSRIVQEANRMIALGHTLPFQVIQDQSLLMIEAWRDLLEVTFLDHPDSVLAVAQQAKADLSRFPISSFQHFDFTKATPAEVRDHLLPFNPGKYAGGRTLPVVNAAYWFPAQPAHWPPQGHVSLVLYGGGGMMCARGDYHLLSAPLKNGCEAWHTYLRTWLDQYGPKGLALTVVERTYGHAVRSMPLSPAAEADSLNWYYRMYLHLPVTVAVVRQADIVTVPAPDGRHAFKDTTAFGHMLGPGSNVGLALLFGYDGTLLYAGRFNENRELLHALIVRALRVPLGNNGERRTNAVSTLFTPAQL